MRRLDIQEANSYLASIKMRVGEWNELTYIDETIRKDKSWLNHRAPTEANQLYRFSLFVTGWISNGSWKILQFDNSNSFSLNETVLLSKLLFDSEKILNFNFIANSTFFYEKSYNKDSIVIDNIQIAEFVHLMLLFGGHGYLVSSADDGDHLGIHDGFVSFVGKDACLTRARTLLTAFDAGQSMWPPWLVGAEIDWQEQALRGVPRAR